MESLLPFTVKGTEEKLRKRLEGGLRVKGTGVGERVKGKIEERTLKSRYVLNFRLEDMWLWGMGGAWSSAMLGKQGRVWIGPDGNV